MSQQHTHATTPLSKNLRQVILLCDGVSGPANLGGLFRLADAFAVERVVFANTEVDLTSSRLRKTARATQLTIPFSISNDLVGIISELKVQNYTVVGLELTTSSIPIQQFKLPNEKALALVVGGEQQGISEEVIQRLDHTVYIEMFGTNSSMNVTQATAIALFEFTKS